MKLSTILKGVIGSLLLSATCVKAETNFEKECSEVKNLTFDCKVNSDGKIDFIELYLNDSTTDKNIDKLLSYKTITKLQLRGLEGKRLFTQKLVDKIGTLSNLKEIDISDYKKKDKNVSFEPFKKLTKITTVDIWADDNGFFEKDLLDKFENVELLNLWDCKLDQKSINTIGSYKKIVKFHTYKVSFEKNLDYSPLKNIKELYLSGDDSQIEKNYIKSFKNLKKLTIQDSSSSIKQSIIDEISTLSTLKELTLDFRTDNEINLNVLKKLKNLTILNLVSYQYKIDISGFNSLKSLDIREIMECSQDLINDIGKSHVPRTVSYMYLKKIMKDYAIEPLPLVSDKMHQKKKSVDEKVITPPIEEPKEVTRRSLDLFSRPPSSSPSSSMGRKISSFFKNKK